jgi:hypothetical protein
MLIKILLNKINIKILYNFIFFLNFYFMFFILFYFKILLSLFEYYFIKKI